MISRARPLFVLVLCASSCGTESAKRPDTGATLPSSGAQSTRDGGWGNPPPNTPPPPAVCGDQNGGGDQHVDFALETLGCLGERFE